MIRIVFKFRKWWWYERIRGRLRLEQDLRKVKKHPFNLCIQRLDSFDDARPLFLCVTRFPPSEDRATIWTPGSAYLNNNNLPLERLVYPPKIYFPTLIIVTVRPLPSHREWNVLPAQPSTDARQQRFQREKTPLATGASQLLKEIKWFLLFPTITEAFKPITNKICFYIFILSYI